METIEQGEIDQMLKDCAYVHKMTQAIREGLGYIEERIARVEKTLRVVSFRKCYAGEDDDE